MELEIREDSLSKPSQLLILGVAAIQGIALYFFYTSLAEDWWPIENEPLTAIIGLWLFLLPITLILTYRRSLADKAYWTILLVLGLLIVPIGYYFGQSHVEDSMKEAGFGSVAAFAVAYFIGLFWIKARLHEAVWFPSYASMFAFSWHNFLSITLAQLFSLLVVGLLFLWGSLFKVININFFADLFSEHWFLIPATTVSFAYAVILFRTQINAVGAVQRILRALFTILLPIVGIVAALFVAFLPVTGTDLIWQKGYGSGTILWFVFVSLFLFNAVFQDATELVYSPRVNRIVRFIPLVLLVLMALCTYGVGVRVHEYGLTVERIWAIILTLFAGGFVLFYSALAVFGRNSWESLFGRANSVMALVVSGVCLLVITSVLSLDRLSIASQVKRLNTGQVEPEKFDYAYLMRLGLHGEKALEQLAMSDLVAENDIALQRLNRAVETKGYDYANDFFGDEKITTAINEHLLVYPPDLKVDKEGLVVQLNLSEIEQCTQAQPCVLIELNINEDPEKERIFLTPSYQGRYQATRVQEYAPGLYNRVGYLNIDLDAQALIESLKAGEVSAQPSSWQNIQIGDQLIRIGEPN